MAVVLTYPFPPEQVAAPSGTLVSWTPQALLNIGYPALLTGKTVPPGSHKDATDLYPDPPIGWNWINWDWNALMGDPSRWGVFLDYMRTTYPADDQGSCSGTAPPLPMRQKEVVACVAGTFLKDGFAPWQAIKDTWRSVVDETKNANPDLGAAMEEGQYPFLTFTNLARSHLNERMTKDGRDGTMYRDAGGIYWNGSAPRMVVQHREYFATAGWDINWLKVWLTVIFPPAGATYILVDDVLIPIAKDLWDKLQDAIKDLACTSIGAAAAEAAGQALKLPPGVGQAALSLLCGGNLPGGGGGTAKGPSVLPYILVGAGLLTAGVVAVLLKKKKS